MEIVMTVVNIKCTEESITLLVNHLKNKSGEFCVGNECDLSSKSLKARASGAIEDNSISLTYEDNHYFDLIAVENYFKDVLFKFDARKYIKKQDVIEILVTEESECYDEDINFDDYDEDDDEDDDEDEEGDGDEDNEFDFDDEDVEYKESLVIDENNNVDNDELGILDLDEKPEEDENQKDDLKEVNIENLEESTDETVAVKLRKPNEVYFEMYKEAREKAKKAKKATILAYLEAKNIKKTYMLDNLTEDSDNEFDAEIEEVTEAELDGL
jgi:hypothetical protein